MSAIIYLVHMNYITMKIKELPNRWVLWLVDPKRCRSAMIWPHDNGFLSEPYSHTAASRQS